MSRRWCGSMAEFVDLHCGERVLRVDASLCEMASDRVFWREFLASARASTGEGIARPARGAVHIASVPHGASVSGSAASTSAMRSVVASGGAASSSATHGVASSGGHSSETGGEASDGAASASATHGVASSGGDASATGGEASDSAASTAATHGVVSSGGDASETGGEASDSAASAFATRGVSASRVDAAASASTSAAGGEPTTRGTLENGPASVEREALASASEPALIVERARVPDGTLIQAPLGECRIERTGNTLRVQVEDGVSRGELVLRLSYYLCAVEQGAVLIHASAMRSGDVALVASGKSGDGKSTLSRLGTGAGLTLLTDEVVMLFPDGRVSGTPFRSDFVHAGTPGLTRARYFLALEKAPNEALKPLAPLAASQLAMSQCFELSELALPRAEVRRRLLSFLSHVEPRTLAFRKDQAAGEFVRAALEMTTVTRL